MNLIKFLILLLGLSFSACTVESPESKQVKGVIMQYNTLLAEGYKKMNMNPLQAVASEDVATKAYYHMAALGEGKVRMVSVLKEMTFDEIAFPLSGAATVTTRETWDFIQVNFVTGKTVLEEKGYPYMMTYELKNDAGQWKVVKVMAMGEKRSGSDLTANGSAQNDAVPTQGSCRADGH
jgi:hypothetical protein